jgi:uncharacterized protein YfaS (alpha-2-macroglobulin family)
MVKHISILLLSAAASCGAAPLFAADAAMPSQDLKATIALNGQTCDQIVETRRNGDSDYTAACKDGNRYHVFVNPQGRVVVVKL